MIFSDFTMPRINTTIHYPKYTSQLHDALKRHLKTIHRFPKHSVSQILIDTGLIDRGIWILSANPKCNRIFALLNNAIAARKTDNFLKRAAHIALFAVTYFHPALGLFAATAQNLCDNSSCYNGSISHLQVNLKQAVYLASFLTNSPQVVVTALAIEILSLAQDTYRYSQLESSENRSQSARETYQAINIVGTLTMLYLRGQTLRSFVKG